MKTDLKNSRVRLYAKILAVVNSLIALPALGGTAASVLLFSMSLDNLNAGVYPLVVSLCIWVITIAGLTLLFGYWRCAFGKLSRAKSNFLWKSTIGYNAFLLAPLAIVFWLSCTDGREGFGFFVYLIANFVYCAAAIVLGIFAMRSDLP